LELYSKFPQPFVFHFLLVRISIYLFNYFALEPKAEEIDWQLCPLIYVHLPVVVFHFNLFKYLPQYFHQAFLPHRSLPIDH
jgi:hypothetical protein